MRARPGLGWRCGGPRGRSSECSGCAEAHLPAASSTPATLHPRDLLRERTPCEPGACGRGAHLVVMVVVVVTPLLVSAVVGGGGGVVPGGGGAVAATPLVLDTATPAGRVL